MISVSIVNTTNIWIFAPKMCQFLLIFKYKFQEIRSYCKLPVCFPTKTLPNFLFLKRTPQFTLGIVLVFIEAWIIEKRNSREGKALLLLLIQYFCISQVPFWTDTQFQLLGRCYCAVGIVRLYLLPYCFHGSFRRKCNIEGHSLFQPLLRSAFCNSSSSSNHDSRCCS